MTGCRVINMSMLFLVLLRSLGGHLSQNACHKRVMKLGDISYKVEVKTIILLFSLPKRQNSNEEENSI